MAKYYIKSGTLELIYSTNQTPWNACKTVLWETNEHDVLDEYFYIDERGYRDYTSADKTTIVIPTEQVISEEGWSQM